jgi:hypothetical protein
LLDAQGGSRCIRGPADEFEASDFIKKFCEPFGNRRVMIA